MKGLGPGEEPKFLDVAPRVAPTAFVAPGADLIGDVEVGDEASIWYGVVLRGDINRIVVGPRSNIQEGSVVHLADDYPCLVGELVTCGHKALLHACTVRDEVLVGMGSIVMDGAVVGERSVIGAGALVTMGTEIPPGSLVLGSPAKVVRKLDQTEQASIKSWAERYVELSRHYLARGIGGATAPPGPAGPEG